MSQVIYARVPDAVKADVDEYAERNGLSLTSAAVDLLQRGLAATAEEHSIRSLEGKLAKLGSEKVALEAKLQLAASELGALRSFAQRASTSTVGTCPKCSASITGFDLLARGACGQCGASLLELLAPRVPARQSLLDDRAVGALVGALGVVLIASAVFGSKGS